MKLSIETKVASVVAAGFLAVTVGAVAQANAGGADDYGVTSNRGVNPDVIQQEYGRAANTPVKPAAEKDVGSPVGL